jgi:hypothetical protein
MWDSLRPSFLEILSHRLQHLSGINIKRFYNALELAYINGRFTDSSGNTLMSLDY